MLHRLITKQIQSHLISVVHSHPTAPRREVIHLPLSLFASITWRKHNLELAWLVHNKICGPVLWDWTSKPNMWDRTCISSVSSLKQSVTLAIFTWSPKACLPMVMGCDQPGTRRGMFLQRIGSRKTVPPRMFLMVPFGLFHIFFSLNSEEKKMHSCMYTHLLLLIIVVVSKVNWVNLKKLMKFTLNSSFIRGDSCTLYSHIIFLGCQSRVDGDLVVCLVPVGQTQVKVLQLNIYVSEDELFIRRKMNN